MIPKDLFTKIKRIEITTSRLVTDIFAGQYHSVFKGRGMEFDELREYDLGDDVRSIDWNVTARTGRLHIKKFVEGRELTVMILVDASRSSQFSSVQELKAKLAAEIAAVFSFSAIRNNDKVGVIIFTDKIEKFIPPQKGKAHVLRVIREVLYFKPQGKGTDIAKALEHLSKVTTRKTVSFLISDFFDCVVNDPHFTPRFKKALTIANKRHDIIAVTLNDPREKTLPECGLLTLEDAETAKTYLVDTSNAQIRERYQTLAQERLSKRERFFDSLGVDHIDVTTDQPYSKALVKFFSRRRKKILRGT